MTVEWPDRPIQEAATDDPRTLAAMNAYQDAMRREQTWRHAIRAALTAADGGRDRMEDDLRELRATVDEQAEQMELWHTVNVPRREMLLQRALRDLHTLIEQATKWVDHEP